MTLTIDLVPRMDGGDRTKWQGDQHVRPLTDLGWRQAAAMAERRILQYNSCFVCGLDRGPGDGLCIFPGSLDGTKTMAATWEPDTTVSDPDGVVPP